MSVTYQDFNPEMLSNFWQFINERQSIWDKRVRQNLAYPWTDDPIMRAERFTNIYRELDPGTIYAIEEILEKDEPKKDKIFNIMVYRLIGRSDSHRRLGFMRVGEFDQGRFEKILKEIRAEKLPVFTGAYMVGGYAKMGSKDKIENVARLFEKLAKNFDHVYKRIEEAKHPSEVYDAIRENYGFGNFLSYQILVDLLYPLKIYGGEPLLPFSHDEWSSPGPGAKRGVRLLLQKGVRANKLAVMKWLRKNQRKEFDRNKLNFPYLKNEDGSEREVSLANIQNCLCEFHKYIKIKAGTGRGRRKFRVRSKSI